MNEPRLIDVENRTNSMMLEYRMIYNTGVIRIYAENYNNCTNIRRITIETKRDNALANSIGVSVSIDEYEPVYVQVDRLVKIATENPIRFIQWFHKRATNADVKTGNYPRVKKTLFEALG